MLRPEAQPRLARQRPIVHDDVHLRVVEERVLVQVRRADGQPAIVDDRDLRVDVDRVAQLPGSGVHRAREKARVAVVGVDERCYLAARDVRAVVRVDGEERDDAEVVVGRVAELLGEEVDDLG